MVLLCVTVAVIAMLSLFAIHATIALGRMTTPVMSVEKFSKTIKERDIPMQPKDLLKYLESGSFTMEDLTYSPVAEGTIVAMQLAQFAQAAQNQQALNLQAMYQSQSISNVDPQRMQNSIDFMNANYFSQTSK